MKASNRRTVQNPESSVQFKWARREFVCGLVLIVIGALSGIDAWSFGFGSMARIGPGFLPVVVSVILTLLGLAIAFNGFMDPTRLEKSRFLPIAAISLSMITWILTVQRFGFVPATFALVVIASMAYPGRRVVETLLAAIAISVAGAVLFITGFGVPLDYVALP